MPAERRIHHNFVIANYNSEGAIDTDDGSAYYQTHDNFFALGANGLKSDFGGHDNRHTRNIYAYVSVCFGAPMPFRYFQVIVYIVLIYIYIIYIYIYNIYIY